MQKKLSKKLEWSPPAFFIGVPLQKSTPLPLEFSQQEEY